MKEPIDPGPLATSEQAAQGFAEADALLERLKPFNLSGAVENLAADPPSWEAVAMLAEYVKRLRKYEFDSKGGSASKRKDVTDPLILAFKADYVAAKGKERGWKEAAAEKFDIGRKRFKNL